MTRRTSNQRYAVSIMTNLIPPYRMPLYGRLGEHFGLSVVLSGGESNRAGWEKCCEALPHVEVRQAAGTTLAIRKGRRRRTSDLRYLAINPGYLLNLIRSAPDAVISSEMGVRTFCAILYGWLFDKPVWVMSEGTPHTESSCGWARRCFRKLLIPCVRRWISHGDSASAYLESAGVHRERILQIQHTVDESLFRQDVEPLFQILPRPALLHVGQLVERKGIHLLLESASRLQGRGLKFSLLLVGDGPQRRSLEAQSLRLGLKNVRFHGAQPPEAMPAVYRSADCLVFPTLEDVWGLVATEAMWSGLPVLSSVYAGCTREIVPAENRFDPLDPNDFDRALRRAVGGTLQPADTTKLRTAEQIANLMIAEVEGELAQREFHLRGSRAPTEISA